MRILSLLTVSLLLAVAGSKAQAADDLIGKRFMDVRAEDPDGHLHRLSEYAGKGKWVLVDFWASWCGPSQAEIPNVVEAYKKYHDHGLDIVAFSFDCDMDEWMDAIKCWEMPWTHLNGDGEPGMVYDVVAIPDNVLIDPEGTVVARGLRGEQLGEFLSRVIPVTEPVSAKAMVCDETGCNTDEESAQDGPAPVDLGLSVCWWPFNVGATKESEYGSYFAFGEIRPKSDYYWSTYQFHTEGNRDVSVEFSKYNTQVGRGVLDRKTVLEMEDDAANAILDGIGRIPTKAEWNELMTNCTWVWTTQDNTYGYLVTSDINGNSIFLPAAGLMEGPTINRSGISGAYWSANLVPGESTSAYAFSFDSARLEAIVRCTGLTIRPVCDKTEAQMADIPMPKARPEPAPQPAPESWVHSFTNVNEKRGVKSKGQLIMEYHPATDSMYVCVKAEEQYEFGIFNVECLVSGTYIPEGENKGFAYDNDVKMICNLNFDGTADEKIDLLRNYKRHFSVSRIIPVHTLRKMEVISGSADKLVVKGLNEGSYTFDFERTDVLPSRMCYWDKLIPQHDEILAVSAMSNEEFFTMLLQMDL